MWLKGCSLPGYCVLRMCHQSLPQIVVEQWKHLNMDTEGERIRITLAHALGRVHDEKCPLKSVHPIIVLASDLDPG
ncbi:hypothetical protein H5410_029785 [Solanum commersonii]|uniref:Uncharacterized protein n=1 Tax=Solanum commersonii TaxID=4109 RepID=A0A9J5YF19_SOLCO|nr:hypothetical protein H5410_029785 [Solanum commersonii]